MRGCARRERERVIVLAHQIEAMARQRTLRSIDHYLKPAKQRQRSGARDMIAMFKRMKARQASGSDAVDAQT